MSQAQKLCPWFTETYGRSPLLSPAYICSARLTSFKLLMHLVRMARSLALARAGRSMAARMAMMAMTTRSSIRVKAVLLAPGALAGITFAALLVFITRFFRPERDNSPALAHVFSIIG